MMLTKQDGLAKIQELVERYQRAYAQSPTLATFANETQFRIEYLNKFLAALGWDVDNKIAASPQLREVVHEDAVYVVSGAEDGRSTKKRPDYALRIGGERKFFVEAKPPTVRIKTDANAAFQIRRYGWSAKMAVSVLTNFETLLIYDCRIRPEPSDAPNVALLREFGIGDYVFRFDELYELLSREAVISGNFDQEFGQRVLRGTQEFDDFFLSQIENWRIRLARDIVKRNAGLDDESLSFVVQRLINRIVFLRVCEEREIQDFRALQQINNYEELKHLFSEADRRYDSGLFDFVEDQLSLNIDLGSETLVDIFRELYYPQSPYAFSVVETSLISQIYERFLGRELRLVGNNDVRIVAKPEVVDAAGVVPTPPYVVDEIVKRTLGPLCEGKTPQELTTFRVADISCGSGIFLIAAYEFLLDYHLEWYAKHQSVQYDDRFFQGVGGDLRLTLHEKRRILLNSIFGVDIDPQAVEVTQFSLLLRLVEGVSKVEIDAYIRNGHDRALPSLAENVVVGNSLVDSSYFSFDPSVRVSREVYQRIRPLDWHEVFPRVMQEGGFDAIMGNPPYIRIQNMVSHSPQEVDFYRSSHSPYNTARHADFDKYFLFIERAIQLTKPSGKVGFIVIHKFFVVESGSSLRRLISSGHHLSEIIHFGVQQVFEGRSTYTCILILSNTENFEFTVEHATRLIEWRYSRKALSTSYRSDSITHQPWVFLNPAIQPLFDRITAENPVKLLQQARVFVGLQTSADAVYVILDQAIEGTIDAPARTGRVSAVTDQLIHFLDCNGEQHSVERALVRPLLYKVTLEAFERPRPNAHLIFPYRIVGTKAIPIAEEEMQQRFPNALRYLRRHKDALRGRDLRGGSPSDPWYRFGRTQSLTQFDNSPKLITRTLSTQPRYSYDDTGITVTGGGNGPYYLVRMLPTSRLSLYYLQAILCHPVIDTMVMSRSSQFQGGYGSHSKQYLEKIPIRDIDFGNSSDSASHDEIVNLVQELIACKEVLANETLPSRRSQEQRRCKTLQNRINEMISQLYNLSLEDLSLIEQSLHDEE